MSGRESGAVADAMVAADEGVFLGIRGSAALNEFVSLTESHETGSRSDSCPGLLPMGAGAKTNVLSTG
jgi:hypothetical protein